MANSQNVTDEELELERQRELEEEEKNSDVDTSIPKEDESEEETEEEGQGEEEAPAEDENEEPEEEQAPDGADEDKPEPRQTRKERRAERAKRFSELRDESLQRDRYRQQLLNRPAYNPMDYNKTDEELTVEQLQQDRNQYGDSRFSEGAALERFYAEQERFNDKLEADNDYILSKPEFAFLDESSDNFDADLAENINDLYLSMAGYDDNSKTFANTGIRYKQFVPMVKSMLDKYATIHNSQSGSTARKTRSTTGVTPTGGKRESTRTFTPEQIARMSPAQYSRYEKDLERQINERLAKGI